MREISEKELREIQLGMLEYVDKVCRENDIEYTLAGGSLIGAMRHGGYIPWDDDIDIELTRTNYEKLIAQLMDKLPDYYSLIYYKVHPAYLPFAKIYDNRTEYTSKIDTLNRGTGVFLDIFPMDILPDNEQERADFKKEFLKKAIQLTASNPNGLDFASASKKLYFWGKLVLWMPQHLKYKGQSRVLAEKLDDFMQKYAMSDNNLVSYLYTGYKNAIFPKEIWEEYEDVQFEHLTARKLKNHDAYLERQYGDYMQLPPENERVNHSYYHWYWKEEK
jgi:lipopolysaccharide cholinephosphotransferase